MNEQAPTSDSQPSMSCCSSGRRSAGWRWFLLGLIIFGAVMVLLHRRGPNPLKDWPTDFPGALAASSLSGRPVLLVFTASWCPPCQEMKHSSWTDPRVQQVVKEDFEPVVVDVDARASKPLLARFEVSGIPTMVVTDASGRPLAEGQFMTADVLLRFLQQARTTATSRPATSTAP